MHIPLCLMLKALGSSTHTMSLGPASPHVLHPGMKTGVRLPYLSFLSTAESSYCRGVEDCSEEGLESRLWNEHMHNTSQRTPASVREVTSLSLSSPYAHSTVGNLYLLLMCLEHRKLWSQSLWKTLKNCFQLVVLILYFCGLFRCKYNLHFFSLNWLLFSSTSPSSQACSEF